MADDDRIETAREEASAHAEMFRERFLTAELAFWAALMSLAGIFVSAASVVVAVGDKKAFGWLLGAAVVATFSMALLILNFRARRSLYRFLGKPPPEEVWDSTDAFVRYVEHARKKKRDAVAEQQRCEWAGAGGLRLPSRKRCSTRSRIISLWSALLSPMKKKPNKAPEPTTLLVTPRADARGALSRLVAHL